jgi:hypothetical protein
MGPTFIDSKSHLETTHQSTVHQYVTGKLIMRGRRVIRVEPVQARRLEAFGLPPSYCLP